MSSHDISMTVDRNSTTPSGAPAPNGAPVSSSPSEAPLSKQSRRASALQRLLLVAIVLISGTATVLAARRTSTTFDEITAMAGGARGFGTGHFDMAHDLPPVMQYLYGLPIHLSGINLPAEERTDTVPHRYLYAREMLWQSGNNADRIIFIARLVSAACALTLVLLTYFFTLRSFGPLAAVIAAALVAFLPDVLAHGGVSYNDIGHAPAFLAALFGLDAAVRRPSPGRGALAGALVSLALGIKHSALALGPAAIVLLLIEALARQDRRTWWPRVLAAVAAAVVVGYLVQVALYRGDFTLTYLREGTLGLNSHVTGGHGVPTYLLGEFRGQSWWYFYPVAFLFKTPVALHLLMLLALLGGVRTMRDRPWRELLRSNARPYVIGVIVFGAFLVSANLTIGFRYALPLLPLVGILTAAGVARLWQQSGRLVRGAVVGLVLWSACSALSFYPHFLTYTSEHQPDKDRGYEVFVDSSLDWGQGLIELRDFMREENIPQIYLSYFGSAMPEGYGIDYVPLPSFFPLTYKPLPETNRPKFVAVSATNLIGLYLSADAFAALREREPYRVLGHSIFVYQVDE